MNARQRALAATAASLFLANFGNAVVVTPARAADKIKCEGVNQCKQHSDCKTALSSCKQQNECKGKGFLLLTPEECEKAKAEMAKSDMGQQGK